MTEGKEEGKEKQRNTGRRRETLRQGETERAVDRGRRPSTFATYVCANCIERRHRKHDVNGSGHTHPLTRDAGVFGSSSRPVPWGALARWAQLSQTPGLSIGLCHSFANTEEQLSLTGSHLLPGKPGNTCLAVCPGSPCARVGILTDYREFVLDL